MRALLTGLLMLAAPLGTYAQGLDLDAPEAPAPGSGRLARTLIDDLASQIEVHAASNALQGALPERAEARFSQAMRVLAHRLLEHAEEAGADGSAHALVAFELIEGFDGAEALAEHARATLNMPLLVALERCAGRAESERIPPDAGALDRWLRDLLAHPVRLAIESPPAPSFAPAPTIGWLTTDPTRAPTHRADTDRLVAPIERLESEAPDGADQRLVEHRALLVEALDWHAYAPQAAAQLQTMSGAASRVLDPPAWMPPALVERLKSEVLRESVRLTDRATRDAASERLRAGTTLMDLANGLSGIRLSRGNDAAIAQQALTRTLTRALDENAPVGSLDTFRRSIGVLVEGATLPTDTSVVQKVRPAWRVLETRRASTERATLNAIRRLGDEPDAASDPAVLSAIAAQSRLIEDFRALERISTFLTVDARDPSRGRLAAQRRLAGDRVLQLGKDLAKSDRADEALQTLRDLDGALTDLTAIPGEQRLRLGDAATVAMSDAKDAELVAMLDRARPAWLAAWAGDRLYREQTGANAETLRLRLRLLRELIPRLQDGAEMLDIAQQTHAEHGMGVRAWPGVHLTREGALALADGIDGPLRSATARVLDDDEAGARRAMARFDATFAPARLLTRLDRELRARSVRDGHTLIELSAPPVDHPDPRVASWMAPAREDLAAFSRYGCELGHAHATEIDRRRADELRAHVNAIATDLLARWDEGMLGD